METVFVDPTVFEGDGCANSAAAFGMGVGGEGAGPGDVAMAGGVEGTR